MRRTVLKWILRLLATVTTLAVIAAVSVVVVMNTERGTRWALEWASAAVPGELVIGEFEGTLWRGLRFSELSFSDDNLQIAAAGLEIKVNWPASALGYVRLQRVNATSIVLELAGGDGEPASGLDVPPLPVVVAVAGSTVGELRVLSGAQETALRDIQLRSLRYEQQTISLGSVALALEDVALQAADAAVTLAGAGPLRAEIGWRLADGDWSGQGSLRGSLESIEFMQSIAGPFPASASGRVLLLGRSEPFFDVVLRWKTWSFENFDLLDGELSLAGLLDDYEIVSANADLVSDARRVRVSVAGRGDRQGLGAFAATASFEAIAASVDGNFTWLPAIASEFRGRVQSGPNLAAFEGSLSGEDLAATIVLQLSNLGDVLPGYSGQVTADATLVTTTDGPQVRFRLLGQQLGADALGQAVFATEVAGTVDIAASGVAARIDAASVAVAPAGEWLLDGRADARWAAGALDVAAHRWVGDFGTLQVDSLAASPASMAVEARLVDIPLGLAEPWLPGNYRVAGMANAAVNLRRGNAGWSGTVVWRQDGTAITVTDIDAAAVTIRVPEAVAEATLTGNAVVGRASLAIEPGVEATLDVKLADLSAPESMHAELRIRGEDFDWLPALVPDIDAVDGVLVADIAADGSPSAPSFTGKAEWRDGRLLVPALNAGFDAIEIVVAGASDGSLRLEGSALAGDGTLAVSGRATDILQRDRTLTLSITGQDANLVDWPEYRVRATPELRVTGRGEAWQYAGGITIPWAELALPETTAGAVTVSPDIVVLGEQPAQSTQLRWTGEASLVLGDEFSFRALGLATRLEGELLVRTRPNRPTELVGELALEEGTFDAFGLKLEILDGTLTFTGPVDDPIVDVTAVRVIDTIDGTVTAGVRVQGRAQNLTTTVFAEPAMAEADALSYLVIGRPLNEATEAQGGDLSGAAVALGLKQSARLTQQIGQSIGLDQLSVTGDGGDATALVAGKQINSRVYARYTYGVFSRVGALLLRYRLTERLTLEAGVGETQSIDILYTVERD